jgi:hypothetical protein
MRDVIAILFTSGSQFRVAKISLDDPIFIDYNAENAKALFGKSKVYALFENAWDYAFSMSDEIYFIDHSTNIFQEENDAA